MRILCVAFRLPNGLIVSLPPPFRHHDLYGLMDEIRVGEAYLHVDQGFLSSDGRFVDRIEGLNIAQAAGQIVHKHPSFDHLYSEDMW